MSPHLGSREVALQVLQGPSSAVVVSLSQHSAWHEGMPVVDDPLDSEETGHALIANSKYPRSLRSSATN